MALSYEESKRRMQSALFMSAMPSTASAEVPLATVPMTLAEDNSEHIEAYSGEETFVTCNRYLQYTKYFDEALSYVDKNKNVSIDESQINLTQETNSQYIPFEMDRYYDGIDLMEMALQVHFVNERGFEDYAIPINVKYSDSKIRFGWLVDKRATNIAGKVKIEIIAVGVNEHGDEYLWRTRSNGFINVEQSLAGSGVIEPTQDWYISFVGLMDKKVAEAARYVQSAQDSALSAESYSQQAADSAAQAKNTVDNAAEEMFDSVSESIDTKIVTALADYYTSVQIDETFTKYYTAEETNNKLDDYYTSIEVDEKIAAIDLTSYLEEVNKKIDAIDGLDDLIIDDSVANTVSFYIGSIAPENLIKSISVYSEPSAEWVIAYNKVVDDKIAAATKAIQDDLDSYKETTNADLSAIHDAIDGLPETLASDYYTKEVTDGLLTNKADATRVSTLETKVGTVESVANTNKENLTTVTTKLGELQEAIDGIDTSPSLSYEATYNTDGDYVFKLLETENGVTTVKSQFVIQGGAGGGGTSSSLKIEYVTKTPIIATVNDKIEIVYNFSGTDSSGDSVLEGAYTWKVGNTVIATGIAVSGENTFDITNFISLGSQKVTLVITDDAGSLVTKSWTVQKIDVRLESSFNDRFTYPLGNVSFDYTPHGAISKTVHFILDGEEIGTETTTISGIPTSYTLPAQEHGAHLLEVYMTADMNNSTIESNHIFKDIIWYDAASSVPVIGCVQQNFTTRQYDTTNIIYTVYDPTTETPEVTLAVDGNVVSTLTLDSNTQTWQYKGSDVGSHVLTITCGDTVKTLNAVVEKLDIDIEPVTAGLAFDFNPTGRSNNDANRLWSDGNVSMTVSDNFDWVNGGYQIDETGDQYFCIKAGTSAEIDYKLFADDAKRNGKEFKLIFKTTNVASSDATFLSCMDNTTDTNHIGIKMDVHEANIYAMTESLPLPYSEDDIIEFEFNISKNTETVPMLMGYEDGVSTRPMVYDDSHGFTQTTPKNISLGSPDCDLHIYRFKVYNTSLTDRGILNNFIADARTAEEMIARYNRNQIYDENNLLNPDVLATKCPQLRIIKIECPRFTTDKDDKVAGTRIESVFKGGDPILDNWVATDCVHSGQGTSSNNYGPSGRNLDLIMKTYKNMGNQPVITLGDGETIVNKVSLTRNSVDANYFNVKVNIASSENANNALLQRRYNEFNPYVRPFVRDSAEEAAKVKDTMEFQNCVIFLKETNTDISTHTEFADCEYHLYAIGNIGDSKKTDGSRLTDPDDPYECILEVMDNTLPNSTMPTGYTNEDGSPVYPIAPELWCEGNSAYDALHGDLFDESKATDKENGLADTYGWRYIYEDGTDEQNAQYKATVEGKWKEFYEFVVTSTDEEFKANLRNYVVLDSVMYYYLFTLRYTMTDNHAKNSFWHYGKTGEIDEAGQPIRKFDLCFDYDNDTALGIDNYGRMTYRYGYEEIDYVDGTSDWVWNAPNHVLFLRLRELFDEELSSLYYSLESLGCWSATSLITQFDDWQQQFPEELWRLDIQRKYIRTFTESFINGKAYEEFLRERANGRKKYQRRQFERNQEKYMSSKFAGTVASADDIILRCSVPNTALAVQPNFDITMTPYSHIYLNVKYNTSPPIKVRAVPNQTYTIEYDSELADIIEIYSASCLKSIGDLSACYLTNGSFSNASKIRELTLGSSVEGYNNTNIMTLGLGANNLLNKLDIQNMSGLTHALNLSSLKNLVELYAFGCGTSGVTFANGGLIEIAELPAINAIVMKNLLYLTGLQIASLNNLTTMTVENCTSVGVKSLLEQAPNVNRVRITGINWELNDVTLLDKIYDMYGIDRDGYNIDQSVLSGTVDVPVIRDQRLREFKAAWPDLDISYGTLIEQIPVTFVNYDDSELETQYVDKGGIPVDPLTRENNPLATPVRPSSVSTDYTFDKWDSKLVEVFGPVTIKALYKEDVRKYTIAYTAKNGMRWETAAPYGSTVFYEGDIPQYTAEERAYKYYLFSGWDQSGYVSGDKTINAVYDVCEYTNGYFDGKDIADLRPVDLYAMTRLTKSIDSFNASDYISMKDKITLTLGHDYSYEDIEEKVVISEKTVFSGSNYIDTNIALLDEDRSFVLAVDYTMLSDNNSGAVLMQCYQGDGSNGFKLGYNNTPQFSWGTANTVPSNANEREMLVIRHVKGETSLHVYVSNLAGAAVTYTKLTRDRDPIANSTLVFGCSKASDGAYEKYGQGIVYWSKIWYTDLGDDICRELACWPHEQIGMEMCGFNRYYLSDGSGTRTSMSFLASDLLCRKMAINSSSTNVGGWASAVLKSYLNNRIYDALPIEWRQLIKQVKVKSSIGNKSTEISESNCYVTIPALRNMTSEQNMEPYISEDERISYFVRPEDCICCDEDGTPTQYWTRSPNTYNGTYFWYIKEDGTPYGFSSSTTKMGIRIMLSI